MLGVLELLNIFVHTTWGQSSTGNYGFPFLLNQLVDSFVVLHVSGRGDDAKRRSCGGV